MNTTRWLTFKSLLVLAALLFGSWPSLAQEKPVAPTETVQTAPNTPVVLKRLKGDATATAEAKGAAVWPQKDAGDTVIVYSPPPGATRLDDKVNVTVGGSTVASIQVAVAPRGVDLTAPDKYEPSFKALFILFILAVLVENALALIFRWRPYVANFDTRGTNPLIAFVVSLGFVLIFDIDVVTSLAALYTPNKPTSQIPGQILTAMIIAGGSAGVNRIMQTFGFRPVNSPEQEVRRNLPADQAWISVKSRDVRNAGPLLVLVNDKVVGVIEECRPDTTPFYQFLLRDPSRFPQSGGYLVQAGQSYKIELKPYGDPKGETKGLWGPAEVGSRAVLDLKL